MPLPPSSSSQPGHQFCNADGFAMAFDDAWRHHRRDGREGARTSSETLELILRELAHHPFAQMDATRAREVGEFRLRLHGV